MAHVQKFTKGNMQGLSIHLDRKTENHSNKNIDTERTHLNYDLCEKDGDTLSRMDERLSEVYCMNRKDVKVCCEWIVTLPESLHNESVEYQRKFFEETYEFLTDRYGGQENVVSANVHNDETTPHMHFDFVPVVWDEKKEREKVSAKEVLTRSELKSFHTDLDRHLKERIPEIYQEGILNDKTIGIENIHSLKKYSAEIEQQKEEMANEFKSFKYPQKVLKSIEREVEKKTVGVFNLFEGNETNLNESQNGGAIFIGKHLEDSYSQKFPDIRGTTFYKNKASGEGGAVAIDVTNANSLRFTFSDSLFYENSSKKNGGAFSMYSSKKIANYDDLEFKNVTFYKNSSGHTKGGALSLRNLDYEMPIESSIFFENTGKKNYENVVFEESKVKSTLNLGIDNGTVSEVKTEDVFGKYPVPLTSNRGRFEVGAAIDSKPLPTISVIPRFTNDANEVTKGLADLYK